ncbi:metal ABC transporter permease [Thalassoroseus pseudoceratinae]|uniref:metal ABC transporter permease n=1 Tax=Thalassoroseus pseudoceratinae TaxID=2713176 RepID=UPI001420175F|nr:metal ABC transporter permease [Thalassoroseus pseudoceratinae]
MSIELWTLAIATVTSITCALCGSLLLVNRKSMVSEGLSHAVLPGLVLAFVFIRDYNSPILIFAAAVSGMVMVWLTQLIERSRLVDDDAALGIVFAGMFSVGILIVSAKLRNTHFHADCIIDGNLALAPLDRLIVGGMDLGPRSCVVMCVMLALVVAFIVLAYKELKISIFDPILAERFRLRPALLQFAWLGLVSMTTVAAFDVAGSILIVALMIAPPAAAYLLTDRLGRLLVIAGIVATVSSIGGFYLAMNMDVSPTGPIASFSGVMFLIIFAFAPRRGFIATRLRRIRQRSQTIELLILEFIAHDAQRDLSGLKVPQSSLTRCLKRLIQTGFLRETGSDLELTQKAHDRLQQAF